MISGVAEQPAKLEAGGEVPDPDAEVLVPGVVLPPGRGQAAVGARCDHPDDVGMAFEAADLATFREIPEHHVRAPAGGHRMLGRREGRPRR